MCQALCFALRLTADKAFPCRELSGGPRASVSVTVHVCTRGRGGGQGTNLHHTATGHVLEQPLNIHHLPHSSQENQQPEGREPTLQMRKQQCAGKVTNPKSQVAGQRLKGCRGMARLSLRLDVAPREEVSLNEAKRGDSITFLEPCSCVPFNHRLQIE